jgi:signal transduction histidine kinase
MAEFLGRQVTDAVSTHLDRINVLAGEIENQFHISSRGDPKDSIARSLEEVRTSAGKIAQLPLGSTVAGTGLEDSGRTAFEPVAVDGIVRKVLEKLSAGIAYRRLTIEARLDTENSRVHTFPADLETVLEELLLIAIDTSSEEGVLRVDVAPPDVSDMSSPQDRGTVDITIANTGQLLDRATLASLGQNRFVGPGEGAVWGLSLARQVARNMGTRLAVTENKAGNTFSLHIPVTADD